MRKSRGHESGAARRETVPETFDFSIRPREWPEPPTCDLRISDSPTSDNLTPQPTTNQDAPEAGADGARLSCPGSSVVADEREEDFK